MRGLRRLRFALLLLSLSCVVVLGGSYVDARTGTDEIKGSDSAVESALDNETNGTVVGQRDNITVVTSDSTAVVTDEGTGPRKDAELTAFAPNGSVYYHNSTHDRYWDVDPVTGTETTVEYVYSDRLEAEMCPNNNSCTRNGFERVNLTTGTVTPIFDRITDKVGGTRWHDIDRIDEHRLLVADINKDRAFIVNTTTGEETWTWEAETDFDPESGNPDPDDWTHINDVEYIELEGEPTVMVSVRNHDQVVFIDIEDGLREEWTLGADDETETLYEQHNPDFIPPERGGPAVVVADSENGRIVEYQRTDGAWEQSWEWHDPRMTWPRDADRLPNGHTLMTDSNGDRLIEVDQSGDIVWAADFGFPYDVERLGTGDESTGGQSATELGLQSRSPNASEQSAVDQAVSQAPPSLVNGVAYLLPGWVGRIEILAAVGLAVSGPLLAGIEFRRRFTLSRQWPFVRR